MTITLKVNGTVFTLSNSCPLTMNVPLLASGEGLIVIIDPDIVMNEFKGAASVT